LLGLRRRLWRVVTIAPLPPFASLLGLALLAAALLGALATATLAVAVLAALWLFALTALAAGLFFLARLVLAAGSRTRRALRQTHSLLSVRQG
jgi:hypothetical protein